MRKLIASFALAFATIGAAATTLNPIQLLNPSGSTGGQAILSTGASTAPAWGNVSGTALTGVVPVANGGTNASSASGTALDNITGFASTGFLTRTGAGAYAFQSATNGITLGNLAQAAANTVLANATGSTANVMAFAVPSCSTSASALNWTSGSGLTCNTSVNAAQLGGATFASPGPIGSTTASTGAFTTLSASSTVSGTGFSTYLASPPAIGTTAPAAGKFTTLQATGAITPSSTAGIVGTATNDSPAAGSFGENPNNATTGTSLTTTTNANAASVALGAGDWDLSCVATFNPAGTTTMSALQVGVSTTSATYAAANTGATVLWQLNFTTGQVQVISTPVWPVKLASAGTGYCVVTATFGTSTMTVNGFISARRAR